MEILKYWKSRNKSARYSKKLNTLFKKAIRQLIQFPESAPLSDFEGIRVKIVGNYLILHEVLDESIYILRIWDSRRDPDLLKRSFTVE